MTGKDHHSPVLILGAGPAGLTAAYELSSCGIPSVVLERDSVVGGLARTVEHNGYLFDIGGHRFYTKVPLIETIWRDVLGDDALARRYRAILQSWQPIALDVDIAESAARLRVSLRLRLADAVQAASALAINAAALVTHDRDFSRVHVNADTKPISAVG